MRVEPLISSTAWVAGSWWLGLTALHESEALLGGNFFASPWFAETITRATAGLTGIAAGSAVATALIIAYRRSRMTLLNGSVTDTSRTSIGPYPGDWKHRLPDWRKLSDLNINDKLMVHQLLQSCPAVSLWLWGGKPIFQFEMGSDGKPASGTLVWDYERADPFKKAFADVVALYAAFPTLPATTRSGFHGSATNAVSLIEHCLHVADAAISNTPDFVYQGLVTRPKGMAPLPPKDSHYMPDTFKEQCPIGLIALTALAHDFGKIFTFQVNANGVVTETKGKHGPVGARMIQKMPSVRSLDRIHVQTIVACLAHYHASHTLPLDVDDKTGELTLRDDKTVAVMELVIAADKQVCAKESDSAVSLSDYTSDQLDLRNNSDKLIWESVYLSLCPTPGRQPINGGTDDRIGFKFGKLVYLMEDALLKAVIERMGSIQPPGQRGGMNVLTEAILTQLDAHGMLMKSYKDNELATNQAVFTVEFKQPSDEATIKKQGKRNPRTYKRMIIIHAKSAHFDFTDQQNSAMIPEIKAPTLGKHKTKQAEQDEPSPVELTHEELESKTEKAAPKSNQNPNAQESRPFVLTGFGTDEPSSVPGVHKPTVTTGKGEQKGQHRQQQANQGKGKSKGSVSIGKRPQATNDTSPSFDGSAFNEMLPAKQGRKSKHQLPSISAAKQPAPSIQPIASETAHAPVTDDLDLPDFDFKPALTPTLLPAESPATPPAADPAPMPEPASATAESGLYTVSTLQLQAAPIRQVMLVLEKSTREGMKVVYDQIDGKRVLAARYSNMVNIYPVIPWGDPQVYALLRAGNPMLDLKVVNSNKGIEVLTVTA